MKKTLRNKTFSIILLLILLVGIFFLSYRPVKEKALVIKDVDRNEETIIIVPDREFTLSFVHSVQHTPVYEIIYIDDNNKLILKETRYYSLGIGLPFYEEGGIFENNNGEFIYKFSREFESINIGASPIPEHAIKIGNDIYPLLDFAEPEDLVEIKAIDKWTLKKVF